MPELPDVQVMKEVFDRCALNSRIDDLEVVNAKVLRGVDEKKLKESLRGKTFVESVRRGKYILAGLDTGQALVFHFGMTGYFHQRNGEPDKYRCISFVFENKPSLEYVSIRLLGGVSLSGSVNGFINEKKLGPDALSCTQQEFESRLSAGSGSVKSALMDQEKISGLGNIYADEILYQAHIHPLTPLSSLGEKQLKSLHRTMHRVLDVAIRHHANPAEMPGGYLLTHRKKGEKCPRCDGEVKKINVSGRSSYYCESCQKKVQ